MKRKNMVGENLKRIRIDMGLTQEEVALRSGLSQGYINQLESGRRMYTQKSLEQIADALDISIADFFLKEELDAGVREDKIEYNRTKPDSRTGRKGEEGPHYHSAGYVSHSSEGAACNCQTCI